MSILKSSSLKVAVYLSFRITIYGIYDILIKKIDGKTQNIYLYLLPKCTYK